MEDQMQKVTTRKKGQVDELTVCEDCLCKVCDPDKSMVTPIDDDADSECEVCGYIG